MSALINDRQNVDLQAMCGFALKDLYTPVCKCDRCKNGGAVREEFPRFVSSILILGDQRNGQSAAVAEGITREQAIRLIEHALERLKNGDNAGRRSLILPASFMRGL